MLYYWMSQTITMHHSLQLEFEKIPNTVRYKIFSHYHVVNHATPRFLRGLFSDTVYGLVTTPHIIKWIYRKISDIRRATSPNLNTSRLVLQLSLSNPMKPGVKLRMKMLEQRRQAMLQQHQSDHQFCFLLRCVLYYRLDYMFIFARKTKAGLAQLCL